VELTLQETQQGQPAAGASLQTGGDGVPGNSRRGLYWSGVGLVTISWISAAAFGLYILCFYLGSIPSGQMELWNNNLPRLYDPHRPLVVAAMAAHMAMGASILLLGPVQLIGGIRRRWPWVHRWIGRVYVFAATVAGLGGMVFILGEGTIGGLAMDLGFGLYGVLMMIAGVQTYRHARARRLEAHRAWAIRLFALAVGSWLYRMDYGFWLMAMHGMGHTEAFRGPFDVAMSFFFYLPNLALAELFLRARAMRSRKAFRVATATVLNLATLIVAVGTYYFVRLYWGPGIVHWMSGRAG
jgi:hypothetical protein